MKILYRMSLLVMLLGVARIAPEATTAFAATCLTGYSPANATGYCALNSWQVDTWSDQYHWSAPPGVTVTGTLANGDYRARGPFGITFDTNGTGFVSSPNAGDIYRFGLGLGQHVGTAAATSSGTNYSFGTPLNAAPYPFGATHDQPAGLAFSPSFRLYAVFVLAKALVEIDPGTGNILRTVATFPTNPQGLATDPFTGDLFVSDDKATIYRVSGYETGAATVSTYFVGTAISGHGPTLDGISFNPVDGSMYIADDPYVLHVSAPKNSPVGSLAAVGGSPSGVIRATDTSGTETDINGADGIAIAIANTGPMAGTPFIAVNRNDGNMTLLDLNSNIGTTLVTGGSRGDFAAVGPDGCLYASQSDKVVRVSGGRLLCNFYPTPPLPSTPTLPAHMPTVLTVNPAGIDFNDSTQLSAVLKDTNGEAVPNASVNLASNGHTCTASTDVTGTATCSVTLNSAADQAGVPLKSASNSYTSRTYNVSAGYVGGDAYAGSDPHYQGYTDTSVTPNVVYPRATYTGATATLANGLTVTHEETIIKLQNVPATAVPGSSVQLQANLHSETGSTPDADGDTGTGAILPNEPITLTLAGASCSATTDSTGVGTCSVTAPNDPNGTPESVTASFAGDTYYKDTTDTGSLSMLNQIGTSLTVNPATNNFNDSVTITGALTAGGSGLGGQTVALATNGHSTSTTTAADGTFTWTFTPNTPADKAGDWTASPRVSTQGYGITADFAGAGVYTASHATNTLTISHEEAQILYTGGTNFFAGDTAVLSGTLYEENSSSGILLGGKLVTLSLGANSCSTTTNASGVGTCSVTVPAPATDGTLTAIATFAGDQYHVDSVDSKTANAQMRTALTVNPATNNVNDSVTITGALTAGGSGLGGQTVALATNGHSTSATTAADGTFTWTFTPNTSADKAGDWTASPRVSTQSYGITANYAGAAAYTPATATNTLTISHEEAQIVYTGGTNFFSGDTAVLSGTLFEENSSSGILLGGKLITLSLGANSCSTTTNWVGVGTCSVTVPAPAADGTLTATATFAGDQYHVDSVDSKTATVQTRTSLTVNPATNNFNDSVTITGSLSAGGSGLGGASVALSTNGHTTSVTTAANGSFSWTFTPNTSADKAGDWTASPRVSTQSYGITANYAGAAAYTPAAATNTLIISHEEAQIVYTGDTNFFSGDTAVLSGTLYEENSSSGLLLGNKLVTLSLGANSCSATTNAAGVGTCSVTVPAPAANGTLTAQATFAGDQYHVDSSDSKSASVQYHTQIVGSATGEYHDASTATVILQQSINGVWVAYPNSPNAVTVSINGTVCTARTDASGQVACPFRPVLKNPADGSSSYVGSQTFTASYAPDATHAAPTATLNATIAREETSIKVTGQQYTTEKGMGLLIPSGSPANLSAQLYEGGPEDTPTPLSGALLDASSAVTLTLTITNGDTYQCQGFPDSTGAVKCTTPTAVNESQSGWIGTVTATFPDSDHTYRTSTNNAPTLVYHYGNSTGLGLFVIGDRAADAWWNNDLAAANGATNLSFDQTNTYFWGSQWENTQMQMVSDKQAGFTFGHDPDSMKGYALFPNQQFTCGSRYTSLPGNSPPPPDAIGPYVPVIVSTWVRKQPGPIVRGDIKAIVLVKAGPEYQGNPGHPGRGPIVAWICGGPQNLTKPPFTDATTNSTFTNPNVYQWPAPYAPGSNGNSSGNAWGSGFNPPPK